MDHGNLCTTKKFFFHIPPSSFSMSMSSIHTLGRFHNNSGPGCLFFLCINIQYNFSEFYCYFLLTFTIFPFIFITLLLFSPFTLIFFQTLFFFLCAFFLHTHSNRSIVLPTEVMNQNGEYYILRLQGLKIPSYFSSCKASEPRICFSGSPAPQCMITPLKQMTLQSSPGSCGIQF